MHLVVPVWEKAVVRIRRSLRKQNSFGCLVCKNSHRLMMDDSFKSLAVTPRKDVMCLHKFFWNYISKGYQINDYKLKIQYWKCCKKHQIFLLITNNSILDKTNSSDAEFLWKMYYENALFQSSTIHISNGNKIVTTNALLNYGPNSTIIDKGIVTYLGLKDKNH